MLNSRPHPVPSPRPLRWRGPVAVTTTVLTVHLLLLDQAPPGPGSEHKQGHAAPLQVRQILVPAGRGGAGSKAVAPAVPARHGPAMAATPATEQPTARANAPATPVSRPAPPVTDAGTAAQPAPAPSPFPGGDTPPPTYATRLPPALTLHYTVHQGDATGQAELRWQPADGRYRLSLERSSSTGAAPGAVSQGELGAAGLAPERYAESRRGREQRAVNFQREAGRITFSGPQLQYPLLPGAQDRLSWMLQLPAVLEAEPALREPGSEVLVFVAGTRGDGQVWAFAVQGRQALDLPAGPVAHALHLRRLPTRPYDTRVDVWLDPARHHLPARLLLQFPPAPGSTEWALGPPAAP